MWRSCGIARPSTLNSYRQASFNHFDHFSHPESKASQRLVTLTVIWVWQRIQTEVCLWQQQYLTCQASKIYRHAKAPLQLLPLPAHRFYTVLDIGLYPEGTGMYLRASIDSRCLMCWRNRQHWRFSPAVSLVPTTVTTDRGAQFGSRLWKDLLGLLGHTHYRTMSYHPGAGFTNEFRSPWVVMETVSLPSAMH